jgi:signal transduction histidine kinase
VIIVDGQGRVVADSAGHGQLGVSYSSRPEIEAALAGRPYQHTRHSDTLGADILATAVPILHAGSPIGAVRITQSVDSVNSAVNRSFLGIGLLGLVVICLGLVAGALIAQRIAHPIHRLAETADEVAGGDLETQATVEGSLEQQSLALSFNAMTDRLGRLLTSQQEFVADASHQLRTPLTGLRLQLEELRQLCSDDDPARSELEAALHEVDRLSAIVDELLILSRAGEHAIPGEVVSLPRLADAAVERWRKAAQARNLAISRRSEGVGSTVVCAPADIARALDALVENAVAYSESGGEVLIADGPGTIEVLDRGPGLAPEEEDAVMERFYRGRAGRTVEGTGLGLPIARELASQWGGRVSLANRPGGGAHAVIAFASAAGQHEAETELDAGVAR